MLLQAISIGPAVPLTPFVAQVHSLFREACNLILPGDRLLSLIPEANGNLPQGIRLAMPAAFDFREQLGIGAAAVFRGGILRFGMASLRVDLRGAQPWQAGLERWPTGREGDTHRALRVTWDTVLRIAPRQGLCSVLASGTASRDLALANCARPTLSALIGATRWLRIEPARQALSRLIGLGPGLTPSGDDFICGYLAGLRCSVGLAHDREAFLAAINGWIPQTHDQTTLIGWTYLLQAALGRFSERLLNLANSISRGMPADHVRSATQRALQCGSTSGADSVLGLLFGFAAWK